jgi:hypothetical protein
MLYNKQIPFMNSFIASSGVRDPLLSSNRPQYDRRAYLRAGLKNGGGGLNTYIVATQDANDFSAAVELHKESLV